MKELIAACLVIFLANMAFAQDQQPKGCPIASSALENEMLFNEGPLFVSTGQASLCLSKLIVRAREERPYAQVNDQELIQDLMNARMKAEILENNLDVD